MPPKYCLNLVYRQIGFIQASYRLHIGETPSYPPVSSRFPLRYIKEKRACWNRHVLWDACHLFGKGRTKSNIIQVIHPQIPRSSANANQRKNKESPEVNRRWYGNRTGTDRENDWIWTINGLYKESISVLHGNASFYVLYVNRLHHGFVPQTIFSNLPAQNQVSRIRIA